MKVFSVLDIKAECFGAPFFQLNNAVAQRIIQNMVNDRTTQVGMNPEDYQLYCIGEWNDQDGVITPTKSKVLDVITLQKQPELPITPVDPTDPNLTSRN